MSEQAEWESVPWCGKDGKWCHNTCERHGRCMYFPRKEGVTSEQAKHTRDAVDYMNEFTSVTKAKWSPSVTTRYELSLAKACEALVERDATIAQLLAACEAAMSISDLWLPHDSQGTDILGSPRRISFWESFIIRTLGI